MLRPMVATATVTESDFLAACRRNVDLYAEFVTGNPQADLHRRLQQHFADHDDATAQLPRGHGKTVQTVLRCCWHVGHHPTFRWKYIMQNDDEAKKTGRLVKDILESPEHRAVFPETVPDRRNWGVTSLTVQRPGIMRDPTFQFAGIFGRASGRADGLVADDVCDLRNSIQMAALRPQVIEGWTNTWIPMLDESSPHTAIMWKVGTPYHVSDAMAEFRRVAENRGSFMYEPVDGMRSPWADVWTVEALQRRLEDMGPLAFARAYQLRPITGDELIFDRAWLDRAMYVEIPEWERDNGVMVAAIDWAFTEDNAEAADPDWSACIVAWRSDKGHVYVVDVLRRRCRYIDFRDEAIEFMRHRGVRRAIAEPVGAQKGLVEDMDSLSPFPVEPSPRPKAAKMLDKIGRAARHQGFVRSGRFHIRAEPDGVGVLRPVGDQRIIYDEMTVFPAGDHDDTVDCAVDLMEQEITVGITNEPPTPVRIRRPSHARSAFFPRSK